ncbi:MAG: ATP-dependent zinc metalloprotease FtsH [Actinomycetota bacterium]
MAASPRRGLRYRRAQLFIAAGVVVALVVILGGWWIVSNRSAPPTELRLDEFQSALAEGRVQTATIVDRSSVIEGELVGGEQYSAAFPEAYGEQLTKELLRAGVPAEVDNSEPTTMTDILLGVVPTVLIVGVFLWFVLRMQGGGKAAGFSRTRARVDGEVPVSFADVAGAEEATEELREVVEFLKDPERFSRLGARVPAGVLLVGPPGTGKTLLARAVAGEAEVPFYSISGSDFAEMYVGVGAARVRDLFRRALATAPSIVFIDEIDAVGRHRGTGVGGGHDEREQTLNPLLVQMDGFDAQSGVVLIAATNRLDVLDPALLRPGRFDRHVHVDPPDRAGRLAVLTVHARSTPLAADVDLEAVARRTPGMTGADLAAVVNEAAIAAARRGATSIEAADLSRAVDRAMAGKERPSRVLSAAERKVIAVHEAGHALVAHVAPHTDEVHRVSIVARGAALGHTLLLPEEDRHLHSQPELESRLAVLLAGRAAEQAVFGQVTTGAADDIAQATRLARSMVTEFGMSEKLGPQRYLEAVDAPFLGRDAARPPAVSPETSSQVDAEVGRLVEDAEHRATTIIEANRDVLDSVVDALLESETLEDEALASLLATAAVVRDQMERTEVHDRNQ